MFYNHYEINPFTYNSLVHHLISLQAKYSKLLPLRMDFSFQKNSELYVQRSNDLITSEMSKLTETLLQSEWIVGYQWVVEYGEQTGLHYHAIFYVNGHKYKNVHTASNQAAFYWGIIARQQGRFHDCSLDTKKYVTNIHNPLIYHSNYAYKPLTDALMYLAKNEQKILYFGYQQVMGLSYVEPPSNRGRPRAQLNYNLYQYLMNPVPTIPNTHLNPFNDPINSINGTEFVPSYNPFMTPTVGAITTPSVPTQFKNDNTFVPLIEPTIQVNPFVNNVEIPQVNLTVPDSEVESSCSEDDSLDQSTLLKNSWYRNRELIEAFLNR